MSTSPAERPTIVCRICEVRIKSEFIEQHTKICTLEKEVLLKVESFDNSLRKLAHSIFKYRNDAKNDPRLLENIGSLKKIIDQLLERGRKAEALTALGNGKKEVQKCERYALQTERLVSELSEKFRDEQQIISFAKKLHFVVHD